MDRYRRDVQHGGLPAGRRDPTVYEFWHEFQNGESRAVGICGQKKGHRFHQETELCCSGSREGKKRRNERNDRPEARAQEYFWKKIVEDLHKKISPCPGTNRARDMRTAPFQNQLQHARRRFDSENVSTYQKKI